MIANTEETWAALVAERDRSVVFYGQAADDEAYAATGQSTWQYIRGHLPDLLRVMEWGAGDGRIAIPAAADCGQVVAYEPMVACRELLVRNAEGLANVQVIGRERLAEVGDLSALFCWNTLHHFTYDDVWELAEFAAAHVRGTLLVQYIGWSEWGRQWFAAKRRDPAHGWPCYLWHREQLRELFMAAGLSEPKAVEFGRTSILLFHRNAA